nr:proline-rich receptor-like protein kinase PERK9 [Aegilops tauschii subsp. strangulata]
MPPPPSSFSPSISSPSIPQLLLDPAASLLGRAKARPRASRAPPPPCRSSTSRSPLLASASPPGSRACPAPKERSSSSPRSSGQVPERLLTLSPSPLPASPPAERLPHMRPPPRPRAKFVFELRRRLELLRRRPSSRPEPPCVSSPSLPFVAPDQVASARLRSPGSARPTALARLPPQGLVSASSRGTKLSPPASSDSGCERCSC